MEHLKFSRGIVTPNLILPHHRKKKLDLSEQK